MFHLYGVLTSKSLRALIVLLDFLCKLRLSILRHVPNIYLYVFKAPPYYRFASLVTTTLLGFKPCTVIPAPGALRALKMQKNKAYQRHSRVFDTPYTKPLNVLYHIILQNAISFCKNLRKFFISLILQYVVQFLIHALLLKCATLIQ